MISFNIDKNKDNLSSIKLPISMISHKKDEINQKVFKSYLDLQIVSSPSSLSSHSPLLSSLNTPDFLDKSYLDLPIVTSNPLLSSNTEEYLNLPKVLSPSLSSLSSPPSPLSLLNTPDFLDQLYLFESKEDYLNKESVKENGKKLHRLLGEINGYPCKNCGRSTSNDCYYCHSKSCIPAKDICDGYSKIK